MRRSKYFSFANYLIVNNTIMKYIKKFEEHSEYIAYKESLDFITPNVSYCVLEDEVHYERYSDTKLVARFSVALGGDEVTIAGDTTNISKIEVDGTELPSVSYTHTFQTSGIHVVKYTLIDNTEVSESTFFSCDNLVSVRIPETVTTIGTIAFGYCSSLTDVYIPESVTTISDEAFTACTSLRSVNIPRNVTEIKAHTFYACTQLPSITIPNGVTAIRFGAFAGCQSLTSIEIPNTVTTIEGIPSDFDQRLWSESFHAYNGAFGGCTSLTSLFIPSSVTSIGEGVFGNCSSLSSIVVASGNTHYNSSNDCNAIIETSTNKLLAGCNNTIIPSTISAFGKSAFSGSSLMTSLTIPSTVTSIGDLAFYLCSALDGTITIPSSVTYIGEWAFIGSNNIDGYVMDGCTPPTIGESAFNNDSSYVQGGPPIFVPQGCGSNYITPTGNWSAYRKRIQELS